jgi:hypothetical protein
MNIQTKNRPRSLRVTAAISIVLLSFLTPLSEAATKKKPAPKPTKPVQKTPSKISPSATLAPSTSLVPAASTTTTGSPQAPSSTASPALGLGATSAKGIYRIDHNVTANQRGFFSEMPLNISADFLIFDCSFSSPTCTGTRNAGGEPLRTGPGAAEWAFTKQADGTLKFSLDQLAPDRISCNAYDYNVQTRLVREVTLKPTAVSATGKVTQFTGTWSRDTTLESTIGDTCNRAAAKFVSTVTITDVSELGCNDISLASLCIPSGQVAINYAFGFAPGSTKIDCAIELTINWGDGKTEKLDTTNWGMVTHQYSSAGTYLAKVANRVVSNRHPNCNPANFSLSPFVDRQYEVPPKR